MSNYLATADIGQLGFKNGTTPGGIPRDRGGRSRRCSQSNPARDGLLLRHDGRGDRPLERHVRPLSVRLDRRDRRQRHLQRPVDRLLAGDPDAAAVLGRAQHQHDRARARAPVVRRLRRRSGRGSNIWLNEGFASFAQYLWDEHTGVRTAHEDFELDYSRTANDPFWDIVVADPQRDTMFARAVYRRGAMTLQALREKIGDEPVLRDPAHLGRRAQVRHGHHRGVHRPERADLRTGPVELLPGLAVHPGEAEEVVS